jgi:hypothetical protein
MYTKILHQILRGVNYLFRYQSGPRPQTKVKEPSLFDRQARIPRLQEIGVLLSDSLGMLNDWSAGLGIRNLPFLEALRIISSGVKANLRS